MYRDRTTTLPNMRLKLPGAPVPEETVGSCPAGHGLSSTSPCADGLAARSLSVRRQARSNLSKV